MYCTLLHRYRSSRLGHHVQCAVTKLPDTSREQKALCTALQVVMDSKGFAKLCKESKIMSGRLDLTRVDLCFTKCCDKVRCHPPTKLWLSTLYHCSSMPMPSAATRCAARLQLPVLPPVRCSRRLHRIWPVPDFIERVSEVQLNTHAFWLRCPLSLQLMSLRHLLKVSMAQ